MLAVMSKPSFLYASTAFVSLVYTYIVIGSEVSERHLPMTFAIISLTENGGITQSSSSSALLSDL